MSYGWLEDYCLSKPWAVREHKESWNAVLYRVGGRIFGLKFKDNKGKPIINLKCDPFLSMHYRDAYRHVTSGYHMNKLHWVSVYLRGNTPDGVVRELVDMSYGLVFDGLPRRERRLLESLEGRGNDNE